jgi:hypothetical protein
MGGEYPKGGRYSWGIRPSGGGAIFLGYSSPGAVYLGISPPFERGISWDEQKSFDKGMGK